MRKLLFVSGFIAFLLILSACNKENENINDNENPVDTPLYQHHSEWSYNLGIYEVNLRQYTNDGTIEAFEEHLPRLKDMGAGILWFMPIYPIGEENRLGSLGSYYSVKDYRDVNPEFGTLSEFKDLVDEIHDQGMFVIIDWVANHTSWDNVLTVNSPEFYVTDGSDNFIPPPGTGWTDVIELDYSNGALRNYMISAMKFWITETGIDGFRCDAVDFVPMDFWSEAIADLKALNPGIFMLAEGENPAYYNAGFDMTYAWPLHGFDGGIMKAIYEGSKNAGDLANYFVNDFNRYSVSAYRMYFTSNHDENSWYGTVFEQFGESAELFAVLTQIVDGMPLIYSGQEAGLNERLAFFDKDEITWQDHPFKDIYTRLLELKKENQALWNGEAGTRLQIIPTSSPAKVFAFWREKEGDRVVGIFNLSGSELTFNLEGSGYEETYCDIFGEADLTLSADHEFTLDAWDYLVLAKSSE